MQVTAWRLSVVSSTTPAHLAHPVGGYAKVSVTDKDVVAAADFAIKAQSEESQKVGESLPSKLELEVRDL